MQKNEIYVIYGNTPKTMVKELLSHIKPEQKIPKGTRIGIKPNLVVAKPSTSGATTSPELVEGIVEYFQSKGYKNITILESSWVGDRTSRAFKVCGYEKISEQYGVPLVDLQKDSHVEYDVNGIKINICSKLEEIDYLINVPVLKGHCQTNITCALKNLKGCIPNFEKRRFHTMGLHKSIAYLNKAIKQDLIIVDGIMGDLNFEEGGNPVEMNRVLAATDPVLLDSYAANLLGFEVNDIPYIKIAEELGVGSSDLSNAKIVELNSDEGTPIIRRTNINQPYIDLIKEKNACSACYGTLIHALERLKESGQLNKVRTKIYIGQYYKNKNIEDGIGVGQCARGCANYIPGCPPTARDIVEYFL